MEHQDTKQEVLEMTTSNDLNVTFNPIIRKKDYI